MQQAGKISDLRLQVPFELVPAQYEHSGEVYTKGKHKGQPKRGKCIEKAVVYRADFVYTEDGRQIVEDAKGMPRLHHGLHYECCISKDAVQGQL